MKWVLFREELGWRLYQPDTGVMIRPNSVGGRTHWVERVTPEDRVRLDVESDGGDLLDHAGQQVVLAADERDAETFVLALAEALGAVPLTDHLGRLLNRERAAPLLRDD